jgi:hypothetical protein
MMHSFLRLAAPASLLLIVIVPRLMAQSTQPLTGTLQGVLISPPTDTVATAAATARGGVLAYERGALLLEDNSLGARLLQGKDGRVLATLNDFRTTHLADILSRSPKAAEQARIYDGNHRSGAIMLLSGIAGVFAGGVASQIGDGKGSFPLWLGGTLLIGSGSVRMNRATHALSRAVWWYNHDVVAGN